MFRDLNIVQRAIGFASAMLLIVPGVFSDIIGYGLFALLVLWQMVLRNRLGKGGVSVNSNVV